MIFNWLLIIAKISKVSKELFDITLKVTAVWNDIQIYQKYPWLHLMQYVYKLIFIDIIALGFFRNNDEQVQR